MEALRKKRIREMTQNQVTAFRKAAAARKQKACANKLKTGSTQPQKAYKSPQGLGRVTKKTEKLLPRSPRKKKEVVSNLAKKVGLRIHPDPSLSSSSHRSLPKETEMLVNDFYSHVDVSYTAPGMKDEVTVWEQGVKMKLRKYYLTMHLKEAHALFQERHPDHPISFSVFAKLRPPNVLLLKDTPADQCKCLQHENFMLHLAGVSITYSNELWEDMLCDSENMHGKCWRGECSECGVERLNEKLDESDMTGDGN